MSSSKTDEYRRDWFKLLACSVHTWPICGCDTCWRKITDYLEIQCRESYEKSGGPQ